MLEFHPQSSVSEAVNKFNYTGNHYVCNICIKDTLKSTNEQTWSRGKKGVIEKFILARRMSLCVGIIFVIQFTCQLRTF